MNGEPPKTYHLSQEQQKFYDDNGYLVIKDLVDFTSLYAYKQRFKQLCNGSVQTGGGIFVIKEPRAKGELGEQQINKVQHIVTDDVFFTYIAHPRVLHVVTQIIGDRVNAIHSMFINKPPGTGRHPSHQDMLYFPIRPVEKIVGMWTAVDHVTQDNGALYVVPQSHKPGVLYPHEEKADATKLFHAVVDEEVLAPKEKQVHVEMSPGDTVVLHPLLVHGSGPNVTKNYRKAISCHYASEGCEYVATAGTLHEKMAADFENVLKKKGLYNFDYTDAFRFRSTPVTYAASSL